MAKRYTRQLNLESCDESEIDILVDEFNSRIEEIVSFYFRGWHIINNNISININRGTFIGEIETEKRVDYVTIRGRGTVRKNFLYISAECTNIKRKEGRETAISYQHNMAAIFGTIGGALFAGLWMLIEGLILKSINFYIVAFMFSLGAAILGGVGALIGKELGRKKNSEIANLSDQEEALFQESMEKWESFIDVLIEEVDVFSSNVEITRSQTTVI